MVILPVALAKFLLQQSRDTFKLKDRKEHGTPPTPKGNGFLCHENFMKTFFENDTQNIELLVLLPYSQSHTQVDFQYIQLLDSFA